MVGSAGSRLPGWTLAGLALMLPFEPRRPTWAVAGLQFTLLEVAAAVAMLLLAIASRRRLVEALRRPPLAIVALGSFALAHFASAAVAPAYHGPALVFSLRMAAAACLAGLVTCQGKAVRPALRGLVAASCVVAALAALEGLGVRWLDPFLDRFRMSPFFFGGSRRASGASENPNLCAALLGYGLVAGVGLLSLGHHGARRAAGLTLFLSLGLVFTYSRGGLLAALSGVAVLGAGLRSLGGAAGPALSFGVLGASVAVFAAASPAFLERLVVEQRLATLRARYEPAESSLVLAPGEVRRLSVRVTNTGSRPWRVEDGFRLTCAWHTPNRLNDAGCATPLPGSLALGESVTLSALVRAPDSPGSYALVWEMSGELGRLGRLGVPPPRAVPATVGDGVRTAASHIPALVSEQSRLELWRLAFAMWRERPLLGFGPDNFRRLHASIAGWGIDDPLNSAHNAFLEAAATTGALGLAAFVATLVASVAAARRALLRPGPPEARVDAAILLGLLAAVIAHSTVDHLLSFTAHYLFFGFLVGATAAFDRLPSSTEAAGAHGMAPARQGQPHATSA